MAGADFQSLGVSGLSWSIRYPEVVKYAAVLFWFWMLMVHWLSGREGRYYRAWVANSADKTYPGIPRAQTPGDKEDRPMQLKLVGEYFGVPVELHQEGSRFALAYVAKRGYRPGIYVCQVTKERRLEPPKLREIVDNIVVWADKPVSKRYGFLRLHRQFPDVLIKVMLNDVDVLAHRALPWLITTITASLLIANTFADVSEFSRSLFELEC